VASVAAVGASYGMALSGITTIRRWRVRDTSEQLAYVVFI
jgi:hypothetical protein